jgi:hypothetical protein
MQLCGVNYELMMLASNEIQGLWPLFLAVPVSLVCLVIVSFFASARGHWLGPVLAVPALIVGVLLTCILFLDGRPDSVIPVLWVLFPAPLILGAASTFLFFRRRQRLKP